MIHTDDLYLGAFLLLRGGTLMHVEVRGLNGRRVAFLGIAGEAMDEVLNEYHRGSSVVDLRLFRCEMRRLKDAVFRALRNEEARACESHSRRQGSTASSARTPSGR